MSAYEILVSELRPQTGIFYTHLFVRSVFLFCVFVHDLQWVIFRENGSQNLEHRLSPFLLWRDERARRGVYFWMT